VVFIGDDQPMLDVVTRSIHLRWPDVTPTLAITAAEGLETVERELPDVAIIAGQHLGMSPGAVVKDMRSFSGVPILVLSRTGDELEAVTCLELGADDYIRFPCGMMEMMARMWASLRRAGLISAQIGNGFPVVSGELLINPATLEVFMADRRVSLTATEFRLLHLLAKNRGAVVSHESLGLSLWRDRIFNKQMAKKYIQRLRGKLGDSASEPRWIACVPGLGYRFIGPKPCSQEIRI
jgi:DNA-binding response OmpR family regulator